MKRRVLSFIVALLVFPGCLTGCVQPEGEDLVTQEEDGFADADVVDIYLDGQLMRFDAPARLIDGSAMVPIDQVFEALGASVTFDTIGNTMACEKDGTTVFIPAGSVYPTVNGIAVPLEAAARMVGGNMYVPLGFVEAALGDIVTWDERAQCAYINTEQTASEAAGLGKTPVDFYITATDLVCGTSGNVQRAYVRAGQKLTLQAKVHKDTPGAAGGKAVFRIDGEQVDCVPFCMAATDDYVYVKASYILPVENYASLNEGEEVPLVFEAEIIPDDISEETAAGNNTARFDTVVKGKEYPCNDPAAGAGVDEVKVWSDAGDYLAQPGASLAIRTKLSGSKGHVRVCYFINGILITNEQRYVSASAGATDTFYYYVPWDASGSIDIRIVLENGAQKAISVPIERCDILMRDDALSWKYPSGSNTSPGNRIQINCKVFDDSDVTFSDVRNGLRVVFLVNGTQSEPIEIDRSSGMGPYMGEAFYMYTIPEDCTWPLDVRVVADAGGLYSEAREGNNTASCVVPQIKQGESGPSISISPDDIWYLRSAVVSGGQIELFAAVQNNSLSDSGSISVLFTVDGVQIDPGNSVHSIGPGGGRYLIFHEMWEVPEDLAADPAFSVTIAYRGGQSGSEDTSDNSADMTLPLARADLTVSAVEVKSDYGVLFGGNEATLIATVRNLGPAPAASFAADLLSDGGTAASQTLSLPAYGAVELRLAYDLPELQDERPQNGTITGLSGYVQPEYGAAQMTFGAVVDAADVVAESNETNNTSGPDTMDVATRASEGAVFVMVKSLDYDGIPDASVSITAGGKTASAVTDDAGYCTFHNVPFGEYRVSASAAGYNASQPSEETLYDGNRTDYTELYLDNFSYVVGRVTASGGGALADVTVSVDGKNISTKTDGNGDYTIKIPPGGYTLMFRKVGYGKKDETVTVSAVGNITKDVSMSETDLAYIYGWVYDENGDPFPGMTVEAINASRDTLNSTTTDSDGYYYVEVHLASQSVDAGIRVSGNGFTAVQGVFLKMGLEERCDISFVPASEGQGEVLSSAEVKVTPWTECASMPGTFFNDDYEVTAIYGMFGFDTYVMAYDSVITHLELDTIPDYWLYSGVKSSWSPLQILKVNKIAEAAIDVACFVLPLDIPLAVTMHSANHTMVWIKKISIISDGVEVFTAYPDETGSFACSPDVHVNWDNFSIKYYLKVDPDNGVVNPAAGYGYDRVLLEWNPNTKEFTKVGYYVRIGWDDIYGREIYMDEQGDMTCAMPM